MSIETSTEITISIILANPRLRDEVSRVANDPWKAPEQVCDLLSDIVVDFIEANEIERGRDCAGRGPVNYALVRDVFAKHEGAIR